MRVTGGPTTAIPSPPRGRTNRPSGPTRAAPTSSRPDWVLPLKAGFQQENFLGMNASDYGGGTPVADVWRRDVGHRRGPPRDAPKLVSLPVAHAGRRPATWRCELQDNTVLKPGETLKTFRTFVAVHQGDYFQTLRDYRAVMEAGLNFHPAPATRLRADLVRLGLRARLHPGQCSAPCRSSRSWVSGGWGWMTAGRQRKATGPCCRRNSRNGDADMKALVDKIHAQGFKAQLWWAPLAAIPASDWPSTIPRTAAQRGRLEAEDLLLERLVSLPGRHGGHRTPPAAGDQDVSRLGLRRPEARRPAHERRAALLQPGAPPRPPGGIRGGAAAFFKMIYDTARSIKPDALVEFCPCGTASTSSRCPYLNMSVASDPGSSWQVRTKGKTLKALHGDAIAYFGDHVELSDGRDDFASTLGIGGVVGTHFTWPPGSAQRNRLDLTPDKKQVWGKWIGIYKDKCSRAASISAGCTISASTARKRTPYGNRARCTIRFLRRSGRARSNCAASGGVSTGCSTTRTRIRRRTRATAALDVEFERHLFCPGRSPSR